MNTPDQGGAAIASAATDAEAGAPQASKSEGQPEATAAGEGEKAATDPDPDAAAASTDVRDHGAVADGPLGEGISEEELERQRKERQERIAERRRQVELLRSEVGTQRVKVRPDPKQKLLGLVVTDDHSREVLRTSRMEDWRTEEIALEAGQSAHIVVLAGDELAWFEELERQAAAKRQATRTVANAVHQAVTGGPEAGGAA